MSVSILCGDCRDMLRQMPDESVHMICTSPPYWGLRDYQVAGQIGLEPDFRTYVAAMVEVFREVRRVLRKDGTLWLNLGDSYAGSWGNQGRKEERGMQRPINGGMLTPVHDGRFPTSGFNTGSLDKTPGLKPKDLCGIPWRVAFALQADGWYLRQDIIWAKPNPMPESVTDRCTKAHEYLFLLAKSERYYYDADAIKEEGAMHPSGNSQHKYVGDDPLHRTKAGLIDIRQNVYARVNKRSVWEVATQPFNEAHFATFPPALIEPCIKAGCPIGGTVLDPFAGAGTTGLVADRLQRSAILIELNPTYSAMSERRIVGDAPLFVEIVQPDDYNATDDFTRSIEEAYRVIRERKAAGGKGWGESE